MDELYIDGELVDMPIDSKIGITIQVNDIAEMQDRNGNFSNSFKLPQTKINDEILGRSRLLTSTTNKPYRKLPAKYIQDGVEIVPSGYVEVRKAGGNYDCVIYSGNLDFFSQIKSKKLSDLDMSEFDHVWNFVNVFNSRTRTDGYIYAIIDYWDDGETTPIPYIGITDRKVDARKIFISFFVHTIIRKIFEATNYTLAGDILSSEKYINRLLPFPLDTLEYSEEESNANLFRARVGNGVDTDYVQTGDASFFSISDHTIDFKDDSSPGYFDNSGSLTNGIFTSKVKGIYSFQTDVKVFITGIGNDADIDLSLRVWRINSSGGAILIDQNISGITGANDFSIDLPDVTLAKGDRIYVQLRTILTWYAPYNAVVSIFFNSIFFNSIKKDISYGDEVYVSRMLGDMTQDELIKAVANQLGIIFIPDNVSKIIYFRQFKEIYENKDAGRYIDMSSKLDDKSDFKISFREQGYAKKNWFKYKENTNVTKSGLIPKKGLGNGFFNIDDDILEDEKDIIVLPFNATDDVTRLIGLSICRIPKGNNGVLTNKTGPRMIMLNRTNITGGDIIYLEYVVSPPTPLTTSTDIPLTYFIDESKEGSLGFDRSLMSREYYEFINFMMNKYKKGECVFKLSVKDVHAFDQMVPWYLSQHGNFFFVNKISSFTKNRLTSVELVRL